jgi:hypothetical protein
MADVQRSVSYSGGPNGGTSQLVVDEVLAKTVDLKGGRYTLNRSGGAGGDQLVYEWAADAQRADRTPRDGDEASQLLADHDGATPVLEQDVTSSTTISILEPVKAPQPQVKVATGSAERRTRASSK